MAPFGTIYSYPGNFRVQRVSLMTTICPSSLLLLSFLFLFPSFPKKKNIEQYY